MKRVVKNEVVMLSEKQFLLGAGKEGKGYHLESLQKMVGQLDAMLSYHCKLLVVRIDLHTFYYSEKNTLLSDFIRELRKRLKKKYGHKRLGYLWCREQQAAPTQHYHLALILDGNKNRCGHNIIKLVERIWEGWQQPKPFTPKHCYHLIERGDHDSYQAVFSRLSYLAKVATKGSCPKATNKFDGSRLAPKKV